MNTHTRALSIGLAVWLVCAMSGSAAPAGAAEPSDDSAAVSFVVASDLPIDSNDPIVTTLKVVERGPNPANTVPSALPVPEELAASCIGLEANAVYQDLVREGAELAKAGDVEVAREKFEAARRLCDSDPALPYFLARTYHLDGHLGQAIAHYSLAQALLKRGLVTSSLQAQVVGEKLEAAKAEAKHVSVALTCDDLGVTFAVDGNEALGCPGALNVAAGTNKLTAQKEGYESVSETFTTSEGERLALHLSGMRSSQGGNKNSTISISCSSLKEVQFKAPSDPAPRTVACPFVMSGAPGVYTLSALGSEPREFTVAPGRQLQFKATDDSAEASNEAGGEVAKTAEVDDLHGPGFLAMAGLLTASELDFRNVAADFPEPDDTESSLGFAVRAGVVDQPWDWFLYRFLLRYENWTFGGSDTLHEVSAFAGVAGQYTIEFSWSQLEIGLGVDLGYSIVYAKDSVFADLGQEVELFPNLELDWWLTESFGIGLAFGYEAHLSAQVSDVLDYGGFGRLAAYLGVRTRAP